MGDGVGGLNTSSDNELLLPKVTQTGTGPQITLQLICTYGNVPAV